MVNLDRAESKAPAKLASVTLSAPPVMVTLMAPPANSVPSTTMVVLPDGEIRDPSAPTVAAYEVPAVARAVVPSGLTTLLPTLNALPAPMVNAGVAASKDTDTQVSGSGANHNTCIVTKSDQADA